MPEYRVRLISTIKSLEELEPCWKDLARGRNNPLVEYSWYLACAQELHDDEDLHVIALLDDVGLLAAVAPLAMSERHGVKVLTFLGATTLFEPVSFLYRNDTALKALYKALIETKIPLVFDRVRAESAEYIPSTGISNRLGLWLNLNCHGSGVQEISRDWSSFLSTLTKGRRRELRRKMRLCDGFGKTSFIHAKSDESEFRKCFQIAVSIENSGWKGISGSSLRQRPDHLNFLRNLSEQYKSTGEMRVSLLMIGENPAAMAIHLFHANTLWGLKIGYDEKFRQYSPGILLKHLITEYCIENGIEKIEHLGSYASWQAPWMQHIQPYRILLYFPLGASGLRLFFRSTLANLSTKLARVFRCNRSQRVQDA